MTSAGQKSLKTLETRIVQVLGKYNEGLPVSEFWNHYGQHHELPDKKSLGVRKLGEVFNLFPDKFVYTEIENKIYIQLERELELTFKRAELKEKLILLLLEQSQGLHVSEIWSKFFAKYDPGAREYANPSNFGINSGRRTDLLKLFPDIYTEDKSKLIRLHDHIRKKRTNNSAKSNPTPPAETASTSQSEAGSVLVPAENTLKPSPQKDSLEVLQADIVEVLADHPNGIPIDEYWTVHSQKLGLGKKQLPKPSEYGVTTRGGILHLIPDGVSIIDKEGKQFVFASKAAAEMNWGQNSPYSRFGGPRRPIHYGSPPSMFQNAPFQQSFANAVPGSSMMNPAGPPGRQASNFYTQFSSRSSSAERRDRGDSRMSPFNTQSNHPTENIGEGDRGRSRFDMRPNVHTDRRDTPSPPVKITKVVPPNSKNKSKKTGGQVTIETVAEDVIERLAESKEYVSAARIEKLILQHYGARSLREIKVYDLDKIQAVYQHSRKQCKVNAYIQAFVTTRSIGTVYELSNNLREFVPDQQDFEKLLLGPLLKQPIVFEYFKTPPNGDIMEITTSDILGHLREYLTTNDLWLSKNTSLQDFLQYLTEVYNVEDPYQLGVRLRSLPLAIQVLKKTQRDTGSAVRNAMETMKQNLQRDINQAISNFSKGIITKEPGICQMRHELMVMTPAQVVQHVFSNLITLYDVMEVLGKDNMTKRGSRKHKTWLTAVHQFNAAVKQDPLMSQLFKYAICTSDDSLHQALMEILQVQQQQGQQSLSGEAADTQPPPATAQLVNRIQKYLERCMVSGSLSLLHLSRVESKVLEDFKFGGFTSMAQESFLDFILNNAEIKKYLDDCGGTLMGGSSHGISAADSVYHAEFQDMLDFVHQCRIADPAQNMLIENALCNHYGIKEVKSLGHGSLAHLRTALEKNQQKHRSATVLYEAALAAKSRTFTSTRDSQSGVLGHQTREKALAALQRCPLLEDMAEWTHWEMIFKPELGNLKDFVQKYGGVHTMRVTDKQNAKMQMMTNILALETRPGVLLKVTGDTSANHVASSAEAKDVTKTCGHLVSVIVSNHGVDNAPLALLGNTIQTALLKMQAESSHQESLGLPAAHANAATCFVLDCLTALPKVIAVEVANKVFLDPLSHVVGATKSKGVLLQCAQTSQQRTRLQLLGMKLGIQAWSDSFQSATELPAECLQKAEVLDLGGGEVLEIDDDDDSDDESESDDSDDSEEDDCVVEIDLCSDDDEVTSKSEQVLEVKKEIPGIDQKHVSVSDCSSVMEIESADSEPEVTVIQSDDVSLEKDSGEIGDKEGSTAESPEIAIINAIRRDEFGVGVDLPEDGQKLMVKQQERQGRSLDRLSRDLYSKDTHFVLELIQNADDNSYPPPMMKHGNEVQPSIMFVVDKDCISVYNNESGFEEKHIRALCDVGCSTKGKHKFGYIGQKGIGFKSVFRVTDRPEVHSRGFHICFDVKSGPMGYILPHWIGATENVEEGKRWTTHIALPLKPEMQSVGQTRSLAARFHDVHPSLLLFLHRLRQLTVHNKLDGLTLEMSRRDLGDNVIEIQHGDSTDRWLVIKKMLDASKISLQAKSGVEVESTEIALAFPLLRKEFISSQVLPEKQPVFAFLPLRSYGFRFVIQGDFDVPSSREDVDKDSLWNQWIRSEIHLLVIEALEIFKNHREFRALEAICTYLRFLPMEDEILDFFKPVATNVLQQLRAMPCLPTAGMQWKMPSQLVMCSDILVREVAPSSLLRTHLGFDYLHRDVAAVLNPLVVQNLGIQTLTIHHLIDIGKVIIDKLNSEEDKHSYVVNIAKWLVCIYRSMDEFQRDEEIITELKSLQMIPMADGRIGCLQDKAVFFPLETEKHSKKNSKDHVHILQQDLDTVDTLLFSSSNEVVNSQLRRLLEDLGVRKLTPSDIIHHHIMPVLKNDQWKNKSRELVMAYVTYIHAQYERQPSIVSIEELAPMVVLLTNHGLQKPAEISINFTPAYGSNIIDYKDLLPDYDWLLLDACYLQGTKSQADKQRWQGFLEKLGVSNTLALKQLDVLLTPEELASSHWSGLKEFLPACDQYRIADFQCLPFEGLVLAASKAPSSARAQKHMSTLYKLLEKEWDTHYGKFTTTKVADGNGYTLRDADTSFGHALKSSSWLPARCAVTTMSIDESRAQLQSTLELGIGNQLYVPTQAVRSLLSNQVHYLNIEPSGNSNLASYLAIKFQVKKEEVISMLLSWCSREADTEPKTMFCSLDHLKYIYGHLNENLPLKDLQELFFNHPVIFYTSEVQSQGWEMLVKGTFLKRSEVRWTDPTNLFSKYEESLGSLATGLFKKNLQPVYSVMSSLFLRCCQVQQSPSLEEYMRLLIEIAATNTTARALVDVLKILSQCGKQLGQLGEERSLENEQHNIKIVKSIISGKKIIPTKGGDWVTVDDRPLVSDDKTYEKMFEGKEKVYFIDIGEKIGVFAEKGKRRRNPDPYISPDSVLHFIKSLGIPSLSESVKKLCITEMYKPCPSLQKYMSDIVPYIQKLLYGEYHEIYQALMDKGISEILTNMTFGQVGKLEIVYSLRQLPDVVSVQQERCQVIEDRELCVNHNHVNSYGDINRELARFFSLGDLQCLREIKNTLNELLPLVQDPHADLADFVSQADICSLPLTEPRWNVPAPVIIQEPEPLVESEDEIEEMMTDEVQVLGDPQPSDGLLKSWPPRANPTAAGFSARKSHTAGDTNQADKMWPPPKQPEHYDQTSIPHNLRPSSFPRRDQGEGETPTHGSGTHVSDGGRPATEQGCIGQGDGLHPPGERTPRLRPDGSPTPSQNQMSSDRPRSTETHHPQLHTETGAPGNAPVNSGQDTKDPSTSESGGRQPQGTIHQATDMEESGQKDLSPDTDAQNEDQGSTPPFADEPQVLEYHGYGNYIPNQHNLKRQRMDSGGHAMDTSHRVKEPILFHGPPVWFEGVADEEVYTNLGSCNTLGLPENNQLVDGSTQKDVGRWGELLVNSYLDVCSSSETSSIAGYQWMNERGESGKPYDFLVQIKNESVPDQLSSVYVEVKSTMSDKKAFFEISAEEIKLALEAKESFQIYRVFNAGKPDLVRLSKLDDLASKLHKKQVRLAMVI